MNIDKYLNEDGFGYKDPEGCWWEDAESFLQGYFLGFCCCGRPDANLKFIAKVLQHIQNLKEKVHTEEITYSQWEEQGEKIASTDALYLVYYVLDTKGLTEHGGSVPGWVEPKGIEFMQDVQELYKGIK